MKEEPAAILWDEDDCNSLFILTQAHALVYIQIHPVSANLELASRTHVAVVDGATALLTDFCQAVIPPPMSHATIEATSSISHVCDIPGRLGLGLLLADGTFHKSILSSNLCVAPKDCSSLSTPKNEAASSTWVLGEASDSGCIASRDRMAVLLEEDVLLTVRCEVPQSWATISQEFQDEICVYKLLEGVRSAQPLASIHMDGHIMAISALKSGTKDLLIASDNGTLSRLRLEFDGGGAKLSVKQEIASMSLSDAIRVQLLALKTTK
eukprot:IDg15135t1